MIKLNIKVGIAAQCAKVCKLSLTCIYEKTNFKGNNLFGN